MEKIVIFREEGVKQAVNEAIASEERLHELLAFSESALDADIAIAAGKINLMPQWYSERLPVLFPPDIPFNTKHLLGVIFFLLANYERSAYFFSTAPDFLSLVELGHALHKGFALQEEDLKRLSAGADHANLHNLALALHYVTADVEFEKVQIAYERALQAGVFFERLAATAKQYATFLADRGLSTQAYEVLMPFQAAVFLTEKARISIQTLRCHFEIKRLARTHPNGQLAALKNNLWECLQYYEARQRWNDAAFILMDAAFVAMTEESFAEALGYIQKATHYFEQEALPEFAAQASIQKADLLVRWAEKGQPQFYREAMKACQEALKVFDRETAPDVFADIHQRLGVIYAAMPDEDNKKGVWAAVSVSSFSEALNFYTKAAYPYEFGVICNNQGNAFTKYPPALHSDNYGKALVWYRKALSVRDAKKYPIERALSLLNYLEAAWQLNTENESDAELYHDMQTKAAEVLSLEVPAALKQEAEKHLENLRSLFQPAKAEAVELRLVSSKE